jgi:16S rRNA (cytidine1402-2'-O)-methyltransferase
MDEEPLADSMASAGAASARFRAEAGTLYVVATPLGNLRDITLRAVDILGSADVVAAEDTRVTAVLLRHFGIAARPLSLHEHNEGQRVARILDALGAGRSVALVSDAGTPAVSDPGARLVRAVRDAGFPVVPIPGANAAIAAVSAAGLAADRFLLLGFLPSGAKARRELLAAVAVVPCALVVYEAPHRVAATAAALAEALGGERELVVARELTKKFETITRMPLSEATPWFAAGANRERGEFVLLVDLAPPPEARAPAATLSPDAERWLRALVAELPPARAARVVAAVTREPRDLVYARALALKK